MSRQHIGVLFGGVLLLVVAMGISRFAFTPILPFMRIDEGLSFEAGGYLASSNYIGYFVGALGAGFIYRNKKNVLLLNVLLNVASIILMGLTNTFWLWIILRFIAGATGGYIFVLTSSIVMDYLASHYLTRFSGFLFTGIGLGIAISGLLVPFIEVSYQWEGTWLGLGLLSALFFVTTVLLWRKVTIKDAEKVPKSKDTKFLQGLMPWLILAYGLEGLGYIITGTFLVDIIYNIESLREYAGYSWVVTGLAAAIASPLWSKMISKFATVKVLIIAYILQVIGIILPVLFQTAWSVLLSAFLFGFTFVGIVSLSTGYARELFPKQSGAVVSALTTVYAIGQIIGPILASGFESYFNSFKAPLTLACVVVTLALSVLLFGKWFSERKQGAPVPDVSNNPSSLS
ncbi:MULTISPECIES: YbfB/YjiJ family MFS transporter [Lysinibacillus]|uniref:YbfB/YjiJ family MFS transporter n=1 Tax=Lysinibacillus antri TaxID=2498145 RepID=A0A432L8X6_9BACI|nr:MULTISPECIES: YbfB/YjiJ family MFS transporter [Lysinibacillus]RUL49567.1 YbfB/YjiJ family MFS transporter [Lysinibacillus antri]TSI02305.1 YbfB/YjiJ family MFS transporter [Lysinibacillus sp. BW-2-10]